MPSGWGCKDPTLTIELAYENDFGNEGTPKEKAWVPQSDVLSPPKFDFGIDPESHLQRAPMSFGAKDQRGLYDEAHYSTREINGQIVTIDRSPVLAGKPYQKHKSWIFKGRWEQYINATNHRSRCG